MDIGNYDVFMIKAGLFKLDGGAMFGVVPKVLWQKKKPPDDRNRIRMCTNLLLVKGGGRTILIDTGNGRKFDDKFKDIYAIDYADNDLDRSLSDHGLSRSDITDVIITHLHFDHAGGCTELNESGQAVPAFPRAKYYVMKRHYEWALNPEAKDRASYLEENYKPLLEAGQLVLLDTGGEIIPGVEFIVADGHTIGNLSVLVHGDDRKIFYAGEMIPTSAHVPAPWLMGYDLQPLLTIEEKKHYLPRAAEEEWFVYFSHDPDIPCGLIGPGRKGYELKEVVDLAK